MHQHDDQHDTGARGDLLQTGYDVQLAEHRVAANRHVAPPRRMPAAEAGSANSPSAAAVIPAATRDSPTIQTSSAWTTPPIAREVNPASPSATRQRTAGVRSSAGSANGVPASAPLQPSPGVTRGLKLSTA